MNDKKIKKNLIAVLCVVLAVFVASLAIIIEQRKQIVESQSKANSTPDYEENGYELPNQKHYISGWDRCLDQLRIDCDVAFVGDSITYKSSFDAMFPDLTICNLGVCSDDIKGVNYRVGTLETVRPDQVFLMIGINALKNDNIEECIEDYGVLVDNIRSRGDFELYLMSVTPVSKSDSGNDDPRPDVIIAFNEAIARIAEEKGATYIDLYSRLRDDEGYVQPEYTADGLHLSDDAYEVWAECIEDYID